MSKKLRELQAAKASAVTKMRAVNDTAAAENRDLSAEEKAQYDAAKAEAASLDGQIAREQELIALEAAIPTRQEPGQARGPPAGGQGHVVLRPGADIVTEDNRDADPNRGFRSFGEYARAVRDMAIGSRAGAAMDPRLTPLAAAPSTFAGEGNAGDGGILVPPGFSTNIFTLSLGEDALLPYTDNMPIEGSSMLLPKDETTPWGSNGVRAYWQSEAGAGTQNKPVLGGMDLRLKKLMALVPVSDELLGDTTALEAYLPTKVASSIRWKANEAILFGAGNGTPLGALNGAAAVVQAKDSGQSANTVTTANLFNMFSRLPGSSQGGAVWMINNSVIPALAGLTLGNYPVFLPVGNGATPSLAPSLRFTLMGLPVIISQHAKALSSQGDILLLDLSYYQAITKAQGVQTATSMHLFFDADAMAFRTTFRMDGQPKIAAAISPANGSTTLSPFVQLQAR